MPSKLVPKIILEGTRLTFKTDIAFALNEHPVIVGPRKYRYHSPCHFGRMVCVHQLSLGTRAHQFRAAGAGTGNGNLSHLDQAVRVATLLFMDCRPIPFIHPIGTETNVQE